MRWPLVMAFTIVCHGDLATARRLWRKAVGSRPPGLPNEGIRPEFITTPDELLIAMRGIRSTCGNLPLRELSRRAKSSALGDLIAPAPSSDILRGGRLPHAAYLTAFLQACAQPEHTWLLRVCG
ncbi:hypothetical protein [Streptomyces sp. NPDC003832]